MGNTRMGRRVILGILAPAMVVVCEAQQSGVSERTVADTIRLSRSSVQAHNVEIEEVIYGGRRAVRVTEHPGESPGPAIAILPSTDFAEGTIEIDVAGRPRAGADSALRGFVGIAFHVAPGAAAFRAFYLRPTNGRATDQLRRNHATQYIAMPDFPWHRLRREEPGVYESYVDLAAGAWTKLRIEVSQGRAMLFVHGAAQPSLIVNDLKTGVPRGQIALWIGLGTEAYFGDAIVTRRRQ